MMRAPGQVRGLDIDGFVRLPVLEGGRLKPLDSTARNALLVIRGQQSFRYQDRTVGSGEWILDVLFRPQVADLQPIFVIDDPDVLGLMNMKRGQGSLLLLPADHPVHRRDPAGGQARPRPSRPSCAPSTRARSPTSSSALYLYHRLKNTIQLEQGQGLAAEIAGAGLARRRAARRHAGRPGLLPPPPAAARPEGGGLVELRRGAARPRPWAR